MTTKTNTMDSDDILSWEIDMENKLMRVTVAKNAEPIDMAVCPNYKDVLLTNGVDKFHARIYEADQQTDELRVGIPWANTPFVGMPVRISGPAVDSYNGTPIDNWDFVAVKFNRISYPGTNRANTAVPKFNINKRQCQLLEPLNYRRILP